MSAVPVAIADAMVVALKAAHLSKPLPNVFRHYAPISKLPDLDAVNVSIVYQAKQLTAADRGRRAKNYSFSVSILKRVSDANVELDAMTLLVEEVDEYLYDTALTTSGFRAKCMEVVTVLNYSQQSLEELGEFEAVLTATYRVVA